jgi:hypothetical protein
MRFEVEMSNDQVRPDARPLASPYDLTCTNEECELHGTVAHGARCPKCGLRNHLVFPPEEAAPRLMVPATTPARPAPKRAIGVGETLSRTIFGGFWAIVTLFLVIGALAGLSQGHAAALLAIPVGGLTGLYSAYIFRGGRFRILFW